MALSLKSLLPKGRRGKKPAPAAADDDLLDDPLDDPLGAPLDDPLGEPGEDGFGGDPGDAFAGDDFPGDDLSGDAFAPRPPDETRRLGRRKQIIAGSAAGVALIGLLGGYFMLGGSSPEAPDPATPAAVDSHQQDAGEDAHAAGKRLVVALPPPSQRTPRPAEPPQPLSDPVSESAQSPDRRPWLAPPEDSGAPAPTDPAPIDHGGHDAAANHGETPATTEAPQDHGAPPAADHAADHGNTKDGTDHPPGPATGDHGTPPEAHAEATHGTGHDSAAPQAADTHAPDTHAADTDAGDTHANSAHDTAPDTGHGSAPADHAPSPPAAEPALRIAELPQVPARPLPDQPVPAYDALPEPPPNQASLAEIPADGLHRPTNLGQLPVIAEDGRQAWQVYARPLAESDRGKPRVAVIVGGLGQREDPTAAALSHSHPAITLAFDPYGARLDAWIRGARTAGHEVLLELPAQDADFPHRDPGPLGLLTGLPEAANIGRLERVLADRIGIVGVLGRPLAHETPLASDPEAFINQPSHLTPVLAALAGRGLMYVHGGGQAALAEANKTAGAPAVRIDLMIDADPFAEAIDARLRHLEKLARDNGHALGLADASPLTLERLAVWSSTLPAKGIALVPTSGLIDLPAPNG
ncbi:divergent polysaccharide deacetylase family protein [Roseospirillum parvum]|uniref:Divergent polysaccharide deacetylase n=1 Tax=Roseospirillum parvum TaxID=83401 RepID=A0A1G7TQR7_9PROT|nr:divergent polysaccharide deacetylase family protein [Roseospirillum parvum]SDG37591.1 hypothetical protein SAMN05421742_10173 [Roseospirillum parvum]